MFNSYHRTHSRSNNLPSMTGGQANSPVKALQEQLDLAQKNRLTGLLEIKAGGDTKWNAYFYFGKMIWLSGGTHPVRRLYRQLKLHCPALNLSNLIFSETDDFGICEFQTLQALKERDVLNEEQVQEIVRAIAQEALFDICWEGWRAELNFFIVQKTFFLSLSKLQSLQLDINSSLPRISRQIDAWYNAQLAGISPNDAPKLTTSPTSKQQADENFKILANKINGQRTIRDLAIGFKIDPFRFTRLLRPYVEQGWMQIIPVADLSHRSPEQTQTANQTLSRRSPLIACIDDNLQTIRMMEPIVKTAGYRFLAIQDSTQALIKLIELKPSLIFLDLIMPIATGYEICTQLRRIPQFDRTPIIILTANRSTIDRLRATAVKANGFLAKPVQANKILDTIEKYLGLAQQDSGFMPIAKVKHAA
jgi:two-component system, chemotaxis family, response regulator PixG